MPPPGILPLLLLPIVFLIEDLSSFGISNPIPTVSPGSMPNAKGFYLSILH
jgi:hypothetical protein